MANYVTDVQVLDAESQSRVPAVPDGTRVIIVTCMDCRIDIRNAGGRPQDALRSILLSLHIVAPGSNQIWVVQHTECGMMSRDPDTTLTNATLRTQLLNTPALRPHRESIQKRINVIDYLPITEPSLEDSVRADVRWLREQQPLIPASTVLRGFVYHVPRAPRIDIVQESRKRSYGAPRAQLQTSGKRKRDNFDIAQVGGAARRREHERTADIDVRQAILEYQSLLQVTRDTTRF
ncbi:hypothetical protein EXIGLDRAFT_749671 [Exidia glandulosa HHB12029]|uniref:Carbonic anhydrase n=1 Tax=Exidia glandulosa HHB12029 TaxID=1314781 RepID=A0A166AJD0_EXIGL|nr:hypothetical protein EXIGLDRAFT_749671 [Exidia glandulosa HHB12029]